MTDDEFWSATHELNTIYQWARARYAAPWAVFGAVLLRVAASTGPHVQLPGVIGGRASLNMMATFVAPSGGGKGISDKVARLAWPTEIHEEGLGSGQGIAELFREPTTPDGPRITRAIFSVSEVDHLAALDAGRENNTRATLKAATMGERLGSKGASSATSRMVPPHSYRMCLSIAGQYGHCGVILDDATGGTPQRSLWFPATDPHMPAERATDPGPLNTKLPGLLTRDHEDPTIVTEIIYGTETIAETIIAAHLARQRGEGEALDGHALLTRCKVAAVLAIMDHRTVVSELDWQLSAVVMATSDRTRASVIEHAKQAACAKVRERAMSRAYGDNIVADNKVQRAAKGILAKVKTATAPISPGEIRRSLRSDLRPEFAPALDLLATQNQVHVLDDGHVVHVDSLSTPENTSSNHVDTVVHVDYDATVTELDSRRSNTKPGGKTSCRDWLSGHINQQLTAGNKYLESFAIYAAGAAEDSSKASVANAVYILKESGRIRTAGKSGRTERWCIDPSVRITYKPVDQFVAEYLDALDETVTEVDQDHFYSAVSAAEGIDRDTARKIMTRSPRITCEHIAGTEYVWRISRDDEEAS